MQHARPDVTIASVSAHVLSRTEIIDRAGQTASDAANQAAVDVRPLHRRADLDAASALVALIWDEDEDSKLPSALLRAFVHSGNYVRGAFIDDTLVGFCVAFTGIVDEEVRLHSHITGIHPDHQGRAIGYALKLDQRAWALRRGIDVIEWTTDPLVRRNGFFNLQKLGAEMTAFHIDFYGPMTDGVNAGDESDRVVVRWELGDERAVLAADRALGDPDPVEAARPILTEQGPVTLPSVIPVDGPLRAWVPQDIVSLRREDPDRAHLWRLGLRATMGRAIADGYRARGMTRDGWYVLTR